MDEEVSFKDIVASVKSYIIQFSEDGTKDSVE